jgi:Domain of unknown function (DUF4157)
MAAPAQLVAPPIVHQALRSPGRSLDKATRTAMELRFGHDFGQVRIYADERAVESARAVNAKAYAVGNNIAFNHGEYQPHSASGLDLLAHELTHVVQQTAGRAATIPDRIVLGAAGDSAEREAEQAGGGRSRAAISVQDERCLRRQPQQGDDQPEKKPKPVIQWGDWVFDPKIDPIGPIGGPSLEDINKARHYFDKGGGGANTCPPGWRMRYEGLCCPGYSVDVDRCCPLIRMTSTRGCCAADQYAKDDQCAKYGLPAPTFPGLPGKTPSGPKVPGGPPPEAPLSRSDLPARERNVLSLPPLTVSLDMYFKQNLPGSIVDNDQALRDSLTASGAGTMDELAAWLKKGSQFSVQLTGKASIEGPPAHNRELGEYRAYSVAAALGRLGLAGRVEDSPMLPAACAKLADGIHNCGDTTAAKTADPRDRQVRATLFIRGNP